MVRRTRSYWSSASRSSAGRAASAWGASTRPARRSSSVVRSAVRQLRTSTSIASRHRAADQKRGHHRRDQDVDARLVGACLGVGQVVDDDDVAQRAIGQRKRRDEQILAVEPDRHRGFGLAAPDRGAPKARRHGRCRRPHAAVPLADAHRLQPLVGDQAREQRLKLGGGLGRGIARQLLDLVLGRQQHDAGPQLDVAATPGLHRDAEQRRNREKHGGPGDGAERDERHRPRHPREEMRADKCQHPPHGRRARVERCPWRRRHPLVESVIGLPP